jgi:phospholipase C
MRVLNLVLLAAAAHFSAAAPSSPSSSPVETIIVVMLENRAFDVVRGGPDVSHILFRNKIPLRK